MKGLVTTEDRHVKLGEREISTLLAALRYWQLRQTGESPGNDYDDIASNCGKFESLTPDEVDALCEEINEGMEPLEKLLRKRFPALTDISLRLNYAHWALSFKLRGTQYCAAFDTNYPHEIEKTISKYILTKAYKCALS